MSLNIKNSFHLSNSNEVLINYYCGTVSNLIGFGAGKSFGNVLKATAVHTATSITTSYISNKTIGYANGTER